MVAERGRPIYRTHASIRPEGEALILRTDGRMDGQT
jgi:hypothetical protein